MISLTTPFQPALNKSGHAKLTFLGAIPKLGETQEKDRKTSELLQNEDGSPKMCP